MIIHAILRADLSMLKKNLYLLITLILLAVLTGCTCGSFTILNGSELNTSTKMSMSYEKFNGFKQRNIEVREDETLVISVNIVTEAGSIDAYVAKDNDTTNSTYTGKDIPTSSFTVTITKPGKYTIRVDAQNHTGSYSFSWD